MKTVNKPEPLPLPTIRRYPIYLRAIKAKMAGGELHVSSAVLADELGLDPVLTRKDLAMAGVPGMPRRGYPAKELCEAINRALGWDNATDAALVGAGSLGRALLGYSGFEEQNLSLSVAFDANPALIGESFHGVKVSFGFVSSVRKRRMAKPSVPSSKELLNKMSPAERAPAGRTAHNARKSFFISGSLWL